jgi:hypothetical protein
MVSAALRYLYLPNWAPAFAGEGKKVGTKKGPGFPGPSLCPYGTGVA